MGDSAQGELNNPVWESTGSAPPFPPLPGIVLPSQKANHTWLSNKHDSKLLRRCVCRLRSTAPTVTPLLMPCSLGRNACADPVSAGHQLGLQHWSRWVTVTSRAATGYTFVFSVMHTHTQFSFRVTDGQVQVFSVRLRSSTLRLFLLRSATLSSRWFVCFSYLCRPCAWMCSSAELPEN